MNLNSLDLNKLQVFALVAESRGVSAAAARLALTRSAVSQSVSALEASLRVQLFHRTGRRLVLTREGRLLSERLREYQTQLARTLDEIVNEEREVRGLVRLGLFLGFSRFRLARLLARFTSRHPAATVKLRFAPHAELRALLADGRVDFAFSLTPLGNTSARLRSTRLLRQELVLAGAPRLERSRVTLADLMTTPFVDYYQGEPLVARWIRHHYGRKPPPLDIRIWAATTDLLLELVLEGAGLGVLPHDLAAPFVRRRRLFVLTTSRAPLVDSVWLNQRRMTFSSPLADAFRAAVESELADS
jgi:DNA-binding transcriptional LysR family regulator